MSDVIWLDPYFGINPFQEYPELRGIWADRLLSQLAEEGAIEAIEISAECEIGGIFLIRRDDELIGITGFFPYVGYISKAARHKTSIHEIGLRWHGILPAFRGMGYSTIALSLVAAEAKKRYPEAITMVEIVPQDHNATNIERHFVKIGFKAKGDLEQYDWHPAKWQPYHASIDRLISLRINGAGPKVRRDESSGFKNFFRSRS